MSKSGRAVWNGRCKYICLKRPDDGHFPFFEGNEITVSLKMPAGTPFEPTDAAMQRVTEVLGAGLGGCAPSPDPYRALSVTVLPTGLLTR
jgi:hypothetical protein